jgi:hypothetical protein
MAAPGCLAVNGDEPRASVRYQVADKGHKHLPKDTRVHAPKKPAERVVTRRAMREREYLA